MGLGGCGRAAGYRSRVVEGWGISLFSSPTFRFVLGSRLNFSDDCCFREGWMDSDGDGLRGGGHSGPI